MKAPPAGSASKALRDQHLLVGEIPVVQDVAHHHDVGLGQRIVEEIARLRSVSAIGQPDAGDVLLEDRRHLRQVEARAAQVRVGERHLRGEIALRGADVDEGRCSPSTETSCAMARLAPRLMPVMAARNCLRRAGSA